MKKRLNSLKVIITFAVLLPGASLCVPQEKQDWSSLDQYIQSSMHDWKVPGAAVAIVHDQSPIYMKAFGVRDIHSNQPVTPDTLFDIGSCTKAFTAAAIAILVDEGKMQWNGRVDAYIPFFHLSDPLADENVTIRDLLTHRTGVPEYGLFLLGNLPFDRQEMIRQLVYVKPNAGFRTLFQYNNSMYVTAGYAVEQAAGATWEEFVRRRIFEPLKMNASNTNVITAQSMPDHATPHWKKPDGRVESLPWQNIDVFGPAGSINSNIRDMAKWIAFQLNGGVFEGSRLISENNIREMHTPQMIVPSEDEIPKLFFPDSMQLSYGLGWFVQDYHGHQLILHAGDIGGFATMVVLIPELRTGYIVLINLRSSYRQVLTYMIADDLLHLPKIDWSSRLKKLEADFEVKAEKNVDSWESRLNPNTHPSHDLAAYTGTYSNPAGGDARVSLENGKLTLHFHGLDLEMDHFQYDTFVLVLGGKTRLTFATDADGNVNSFMFYDVEFNRLANSKMKTNGM